MSTENAMPAEVHSHYITICLPPDEDLDDDGNYIGNDPDFLKIFAEESLEFDDMFTEITPNKL